MEDTTTLVAWGTFIGVVVRQQVVRQRVVVQKQVYAQPLVVQQVVAQPFYQQAIVQPQCYGSQQIVVPQAVAVPGCAAFFAR